MRTRIAFLTCSGLLIVPSCRGDIPTEAVETMGRGRNEPTSSNLSCGNRRCRRLPAHATNVEVKHPGIFAASGGIEVNPAHVGARKAASRHSRYRGGSSGNTDFPTLQSQQPDAFQDIGDSTTTNYSRQTSSPHGQSFTWQKRPAPITESLLNFFQAMLQESPTTFGTVAASLAVFILWQFFSRSKWMYTFFVCTRQSTIQSYGLSLLLSTVSHSSVRHLAFDLLALCHLAPKVWKHSSTKFQVTNSGMTLGDILDNKRAETPLWPLFLGCSIFSHTLFIVIQKHQACMGLGGVIFALMGYYYGGVVPPNQILHFMIFGLWPISVRARLLVQILLAVSLVGSFSSRSTTIPHLVHLGGLAFGMVYYRGIKQSVTAGKKALENGVAGTMGKLAKRKRG